MRIVMAALMLLVIGARCEEGSDIPSESLLTVKGRLTTEGVECPALRASNGQLYTLVGAIEDFKAGDRVCVKGKRVESSFCMQGISLKVEWIGLARWCP